MVEIRYEVETKEASPLLINRYVEGTLEEIKVRKGDAKQKKVEDKLYMDGKGNPYVPATYIRNCLIEAGKSVKVQGKGKATYSKLMGSTIMIVPDAILITPGTWEPYTITAVNPMTHGRMTVTRPKFNQWKLKFSIIASDDISEDKLAAIVEEAGRFVGIGDWRPQKKGMFGKFIVEKFKKVE
jgi:hypothetical protein